MPKRLVELPFDPEYISQDGFYMAGYIYGQHVRSEKDARQEFPGATQCHEDFYKGVLDGFNDKMNEMIQKSHTTAINAPKLESRMAPDPPEDSRLESDTINKKIVRHKRQKYYEPL